MENYSFVNGFYLSLVKFLFLFLPIGIIFGNKGKFSMFFSLRFLLVIFIWIFFVNFYCFFYDWRNLKESFLDKIFRRNFLDFKVHFLIFLIILLSVGVYLLLIRVI